MLGPRATPRIGPVSQRISRGSLSVAGVDWAVAGPSAAHGWVVAVGAGCSPRPSPVSSTGVPVSGLGRF